MRRPHAPRLANRWRITLWIVASVLVVTFLLGLFSVAQVKSRFTAEIDEELVSQANSLVAALAVIEPSELAQLAQESTGIADPTYGTTIVGSDGVVLTLPSGPPDAPDPAIDTSPQAVSALRGQAGEPFDLTSGDGSVTYRAVVRQLPDGGLLVITRSLADRDDAVKTVVGVLAFAGAVAAVLIGVTVALVSSLVTRPLDAMIDTAEAIGEGDLTSRVPTEGVEDVARLATALNHMLDRLERAFADKEESEAALRRFVADASHELRTPLAAVLGYAELREAGMAADDAAVDRAMARIRAEGERMRLIVEELLTLARLDEGRTMARALVDLGGLARDAVADARAIDPARTVRLAAPDEPVVVRGDAMSLRQAVDNLMSNTRAHTPAGAVVEVVVRAEAGWAEIDVRDDGPGMEAEVAAHVFDRLYRADPSRQRSAGSDPGGSGLGLAIVAAIADAHGGEARVASTPGAGTTFTLRLPATG